LENQNKKEEIEHMKKFFLSLFSAAILFGCMNGIGSIPLEARASRTSNAQNAETRALVQKKLEERQLDGSLDQNISIADVIEIVLEWVNNMTNRLVGRVVDWVIRMFTGGTLA